MLIEDGVENLQENVEEMQINDLWAMAEETKERFQEFHEKADRMAVSGDNMANVFLAHKAEVEALRNKALLPRWQFVVAIEIKECVSFTSFNLLLLPQSSRSRPSARRLA